MMKQRKMSTLTLVLLLLSLLLFLLVSLTGQQQQQQQHHHKSISICNSNWKNHRHNHQHQHQHQHQHDYHQHQHYYRPFTTAGVAAAFCSRAELISSSSSSSSSTRRSSSSRSSKSQSPLVLFSSSQRQSQSEAEEGSGSGSGSPVDGPGPTKRPSSSRNSPVWFLLVDERGDPFKGAGIDFVERSKAPFVAKFRDAVKTKYDQPNFLKDIPASVLQVYANKAAFKTTKKKKRPLEEDAPISGLGCSKGDAIYVVVPSFSASSTCQIPFYNKIPDAVEKGNSLIFLEQIPSTQTNSLYVRESFREIAQSIAPDSKTEALSVPPKSIVTGTPGIGKSWFLFYLLWKLVKKQSRVLFILHPNTIYYDGKGGIFSFSTGQLPDADNEFWTDDLWCLFDAKEKRDLGGIPYDRCSVVVSTSPRRELINDFKKGPPLAKFFYMPIWSDTELETISHGFPDASQVWRNRFEILGGIPRFVFADRQKGAQAIIDQAAGDSSFWESIKNVGSISALNDKSETVHSLVHMTSVSPYTEASIVLASEAAYEAILQGREEELFQNIGDLIAYGQGSSVLGVMRGICFESVAIRSFEEGGDFVCRKISGPDDTVVGAEFTLNIPSSAKIEVGRVESGQAKGRLHVPINKNYPAIDAWIPGIGAFQMTIAKKHDLNGTDEKVRNDCSLLENRLYWALPKVNFPDGEFTPSFTTKTPDEFRSKLNQYVLLIPRYKAKKKAKEERKEA